MSARSFSVGKSRRDDLFREKDDVTLPILRRIIIRRPGLFYAVLMPSLYGPELFHLRERGVPGRNIFAVERDRQVHAVLADPPDSYPHLFGIQTTPTAMDIRHAIDHIPFTEIDLVYIDLFGQPNGSHLQALIKLFKLHQMLSGTVLIITYGRNRGSAFSCRLNARLVSGTVGQAYVESAIRESGHRIYKEIRGHEYVSRNINFNITEVLF